MAASARDDDLDEVLIEEIRKLTRPEPVEPLPPEQPGEVASLAARLEAVEAPTRVLSDALHQLRGIVRNLNRSRRHYRLFDQLHEESVFLESRLRECLSLVARRHTSDASA